MLMQVAVRERKEQLYMKKREEMLKQALDAADNISQAKKIE